MLLQLATVARHHSDQIACMQVRDTIWNATGLQDCLGIGIAVMLGPCVIPTVLYPPCEMCRLMPR